jgi:ABC-type multidrug transport system permease subunit
MKHHDNNDWMDSDELKNQLLSSYHRRKVISKVLFVFAVIMAIALITFNLWVYCFDI